MMLQFEKDVLGFYVTSNPLSKHADMISVYSTVNTSQLTQKSEGRSIVIGGMVMKIRHLVTKNGRNAGAKMAVFELEDIQGKCEVVVFPRTLDKFGDLLEVDKILFVKGTVDCRRENPNIICEELIDMEQATEQLAARVWVDVLSLDMTEEKVNAIRNLCKTHRGKSPLNVSVQTTGGYRILALADKSLSVRADVDFCTKMEKVVGRGKVKLMRN
jgi:DNA polymerase-3 subunit alpha